MKSAVFVLVILGVAAAGVGWLLYPSWKLRSAFADSKLREYEGRFAPRAGHPSETGAVPPRTGKVLVLSQSTWSAGTSVVPRSKIDPTYLRSYREIEPPRLHESMFRLNAALRASSPEEVATVILCQSAIQRVVEKSNPKESADGDYRHEYGRGTQAYVILDVFDARSLRLLGTCRLEGNQPVQRNGKLEIEQRPDVAAFVSRMRLANR